MNDETEPDEGPLPDLVAKLVAYDTAMATRAGADGSTPDSAEQLPPLSSEFACLDLLHRVWPNNRSQAHVDHDGQIVGRLGDLRLVRELGRGGMGIVYEAEQLSLGRQVAVKVLPDAALVHDKSLKRFRNEVRAAAALDHPHIVAVHGVGEYGGHHYYTMQLIRGRTLARVIADRQQVKEVRKGASSSKGASITNSGEISGTSSSVDFYRAAAQWGSEACSALQHAHDLGILHRDIKPSNLMVDQAGRIYVTDFGLARVGEEAGLTMTGDIVGTLRYMAPEQALGKRVVIDQRVDLCSWRDALRTPDAGASVQ